MPHACADHPSVPEHDLTPERLQRAADAFWAWLRDQLSYEAVEMVENDGVHPDDWQAAAETCVRSALGDPDPQPALTYPNRPR